MTTEPKIIDSHATVMAAVEMMEQGGYRHLPVVKEIVSRLACCR